MMQSEPKRQIDKFIRGNIRYALYELFGPAISMETKNILLSLILEKILSENAEQCINKIKRGIENDQFN